MTKYLSLIFILLLVSACNNNNNISPSSSEKVVNFRSSTKITDNIQMELDRESEEIKRVKDVKLRFKLKNISDKMIVYRFPSGCQYGFTVTKNQDTIFDSREKVGCTAVITHLKLEPGQTKVFPIPFKLFDNNKKLKKGIYKLSAFLLEGHTPKISISFKVE